jgi:glycine cleavage system transcriptional repressor
MKKYIILFSIGKDRPGIVADIATYLFERGANIEDSRMAAMGGQFSIMTLFSCKSEEAERVGAELDYLKERGLTCSLHEAEDPATRPKEAALPIKIEVTAMDHPGIVQRVVHILRQHNINIRSLNTQVRGAPLSGAPLFDLSLEADVPRDVSIATVKNELTGLAIQRNLDLSFNK